MFAKYGLFLQNVLHTQWNQFSEFLLINVIYFWDNFDLLNSLDARLLHSLQISTIAEFFLVPSMIIFFHTSWVALRSFYNVSWWRFLKFTLMNTYQVSKWKFDIPLDKACSYVSVYKKYVFFNQSKQKQTNMRDW